MANFYSDWLKRNRTDNKAILDWLQKENSELEEPNRNESAASHETFERHENVNDITYQNQNYKITIRQEKHKRQKNFKLEDLLFHLKVFPIDGEVPFVLDIIPFLEEAFTAILKKLKTFFNKDEHRIAYLTLYQSPMVTLKAFGIA